MPTPEMAPKSFRAEEFGVFTKFICKVCEELHPHAAYDTLYAAQARDHATWAHLDLSDTTPTRVPTAPLPAEEAAQHHEGTPPADSTLGVGTGPVSAPDAGTPPDAATPPDSAPPTDTKTASTSTKGAA